ncbi:hypothetical protein MRB53_039778 [Persea americana]|nr:hypothetical protein MRB53_039778 [Persea americana]
MAEGKYTAYHVHGPHTRSSTGITVYTRHVCGVEHMMKELMAFDRKTLRISNASGVHSTCIAEYVLGHILSHIHRLPKLQEIQSSRKWDRMKFVPPGRLNGSAELRDMTLGVLGYGAIGREVARLGSAFGMRIIAATRDGRKRAHNGFCVAECDVLVIACPMTASTRGIINAKTLAVMKPTALVINVARGQIIQQDALIDALEDERIGGAVLDVTDPEPLPSNHKLWSTKKLYCHSAYFGCVESI